VARATFDLDQSLDRDIPYHAPVNPRSIPMSTNFVVIVAIVAAFGVFAATLFWADIQTRGLSR
jgi:hypothetical protein